MKTIRSYIAVAGIITSLFFLLSVPHAVAQTANTDPANSLESCFVYYDYGKVSVNLSTEETTYSPGNIITVQGTITNENTFPLVNIILYAQLKRINDSASFDQSGHYLIERIRLAESLNFLPGEKKSIKVSLPVKDSYQNGSYQLQYFIVSKDGYNYAGRPFLEQDVAGSSNFDIEQSGTVPVYFDPTTLTVNGAPHAVREQIVEFDRSPLVFDAKVIDSRSAKTDIPATVQWYSFSDVVAADLVSTQQAVISSTTGNLHISFTPPYPGAFVMIAKLADPHASELKYRFASKGTVSHQLHINDLGTTSYPALPDGHAYVCFHSPSPQKTPPTTVTLFLLDKDNTVVDQKSVTGRFDGEVKAISVPLQKLTSTDNFSIKAQISWQDQTGTKTKEWTNHYGCDTFQSSPKEYQSTYQAGTQSLSLSATNTCGQEVRTGGYIESVKITAADGSVKKELYNQQAGGEDIALGDLPPGNYVAEITDSTNTPKTIQFAVAGAATSAPTSKIMKILLWAVALALLSAMALWYWKKKKQHKKL